MYVFFFQRMRRRFYSPIGFRFCCTTAFGRKPPRWRLQLPEAQASKPLTPASLWQSELQLQARMPLYNELFFFLLPASTNCALVKWQNVNHLVTKWAPAAIVRGWWCRRESNHTKCHVRNQRCNVWFEKTWLLYRDRVSLWHHSNTLLWQLLALTYHHCIKVHWLSWGRKRKDFFF